MPREKLNKNYILQVNHGDGDFTRYDVEVDIRGTDDSRMRMSYSSADHRITPAFRGTEVAKLKDYGDGVKIRVGKQKLNLQYDELEDLLTILTLYNGDKDINPYTTTYRKFREIDID